MSNLEERLTELEIRLSFIDETISGLLDVDVDRARRMLVLENTVAELRRELATVQTTLAGAGDARHEPPPPHY